MSNYFNILPIIYFRDKTGTVVGMFHPAISSEGVLSKLNDYSIDYPSFI